jgi:hypothetical protein
LKVDTDYLRRHYAEISDEALREIDRTELVEAAQKCYDEEVARRRSTPAPTAAPVPLDFVEDEDGPDWLEGAACVCTFTNAPGSDSQVDAAEARDAIEAAGIPSHITLEEIEERRSEYRVLVPASRTLEAMSILDRDVFNARLEAEWTAHLAGLSDSELRALSPDLMCAGLLDRAERLKRAYEDEVGRRNEGGL